MNKYYYICKKLFNGQVLVRDYNLNDCYKSKCDLVLTLEKSKSKMIIPYSEIKSAAKLIDITWLSKIKGQKPYRNYSFKWIPEKLEDKNQKLF